MYVIVKAVLLVVCLSTNGERALNYTIVKWLILTTNTQATKIKSSFLITYAVKGIQGHSNRSPQLFELKKKQQNQVTLFKVFFVTFLIVVLLRTILSHNWTYLRKTYLRGSSSGQWIYKLMLLSKAYNCDKYRLTRIEMELP